MTNPFGNQLVEAYGPDHGITIERNGLTYDVTIDGGPVHNVASVSVAEALNEAAEGASRADFLRILGVPEAEDAAAPAEDYDHDGDGPADVEEAAAEPGTDASDDPAEEIDLDLCPICGAPGGEDCREGCNCDWCQGQGRVAETAADPGSLAAAIEAAGDGGAVLIPAGAPLTETTGNDGDGTPVDDVPPTEETPTATDPTAVDPALAERAKAYDGQGFAELRRALTARRGTPTPRGTTREAIALELARLDIEAAGPSAAGPTSAEAPAPPEAHAPETVDDDCDGAELGDTFLHTHAETPPEPGATMTVSALSARIAEVGRLYRTASGLLVKLIAPGVAVYFDGTGQVCSYLPAPEEMLSVVPDGTPFEPVLSEHKDERIPAPGTVLSRQHNDATWRLRVERKGFALIAPDGVETPQRSLSSAARTVMGGTRVNGPAFWGLNDTPAAVAEREAAKLARRRERTGLRLVKHVRDWIAEGTVSPAVRAALVEAVASLGGEST